MQLVAYGAQDIYLTGNPQITFFKVVYRRHTNFSMEAIEQTFSGNVSFGGRADATISRNGDLIHKMYFEINPSLISTSANSTAAYMGNGLFKAVEIQIGGQMIDKHYREWLSTWADLTEKNDLGGAGGLDSGVPGNYNNALSMGGWGETDPRALPPTQWQRMSYNIMGTNKYKANTKLPTNIVKAFVPLQFWFCRNPGLALPLIALQYHEVKLFIDFAKADEVCHTPNAAGVLDNSSCKLWVDYIYLDTDERRRFAQVSHEYLIEQVQRQKFSHDSTFDLNFNHPVKELIWGATPVTGVTTDDFDSPSLLGKIGGGGLTTEAGSNITLKLNGHERFSKRHPLYFSNCQVFQHHTGRGGVCNVDSLNVYSFALKPEEHQPSGTCNFSRIDSAELLYGGTTAGGTGVTIFAVNYNVLRIMSGMGGLAYSN